MTAFAFRIPGSTGNMNDVYDDQGPGFAFRYNHASLILSVFGPIHFPCGFLIIPLSSRLDRQYSNHTVSQFAYFVKGRISGETRDP